MPEVPLAHKHIYKLRVAAQDLLPRLQDLDQVPVQIKFFILRTQIDTILFKVLNPHHHALIDIRELLAVPTEEVIIRMIGILEGCVQDFEAGVLKEVP